MGDVLTSGDLLEGHNDLGQPMLVDPTEAIQLKMLDYLLVEDFFVQFKPAKFRLRNSRFLR